MLAAQPLVRLSLDILQLPPPLEANQPPRRRRRSRRIDSRKRTMTSTRTKNDKDEDAVDEMRLTNKRQAYLVPTSYDSLFVLR